jgi:3-oxoacyl-[acyl-carrier-protein] synthase-3
MTPVSRGGILATDMGSDGSAVELLYMPGGGSKCPPSHTSVDQRLHYLRMNGSEIFKLAVRRMADSAERVMKDAGVTPEHVECFIPHQANARIISAAAGRLRLPVERCVVNVERLGNTSAASIPVAMAEAAEDGRIKDGDLVLLSGFGAGMTWASSVLRWGRPVVFDS